MTLTAEVRPREAPAMLKRPLQGADTPASCVLSNHGTARRGCFPRPGRPPVPTQRSENTCSSGTAVQPWRWLGFKR